MPLTPLPVAVTARANETSLIQRLQHQDKTALGELYDLYGRLTYSLILRIVHDWGIAEDLVQETFLSVWSRRSLLDPQQGVVGPWLLTVARNRAFDYLRSSSGRWRYGAERLHEIEDPKLYAALEQSVLISVEINILCDALERLSANQRAVIDLAYFEGYSQTEIATKLGYPLGTVKTWIRSALKTLREDLKESSAGQTASSSAFVTSRVNPKL